MCWEREGPRSFFEANLKRVARYQLGLESKFFTHENSQKFLNLLTQHLGLIFTPPLSSKNKQYRE